MYEQSETSVPKRKFMQFPWKYRESFMVSATLVILGFIIEFAFGSKGVSLPGWPANLLMLMLFIAYVLVFHFLIKHPVKKWLSSVPAAISSITMFAFLVLLMAFIPQDTQNVSTFISKTGLDHITRSWPFLFSSLFLLFVLSFTIIRRFLPFSLKNIAFTLNHLGLFIVVVAASLGASDTYKLTMMLNENKITVAAFNERGQAFDLGFGLKLIKFSIDEYPPQMAVINSRSGKILYPGKTLPEAKKGNRAVFGNWTIEVNDFIENAQKDSIGYVITSAYGSAPAALVNAFNNKTNDTVRGWVTSGSPYVYPENLELSGDEAIAMTIRRPKKFSSYIRAFYGTNKTEDFTVEVNKPAHLKGWTIYQTGYDEEMGKWSTRSIIQLVNDPWLPVVYTGIFMILAGALYLLWKGRSTLS